MRPVILLLVLLSLPLPANAALKIAFWMLDNGAKVLFVESHGVPIIDVSVEFDAGTRRDPPGKSGLASLTNQSLARVLAEPDFPESAFKRDQARAIASLREALSKPEVLAERALQQLMYASHPYAQVETSQTLAAVSRADLRAFHAAHYGASHAVVAIIGDLTRSEAEAIARDLTQQLAPGAPLPALPPVEPLQAVEQGILHPASQAHIMLGVPALTRGDADYFPLTVGNYVLGGGGFVSRLMREVREQRGLAYSVDSHFLPLAQSGPFKISLQTQKAQAAAALTLVRATLRTFLRTGPTVPELQATKAHLIGGFALRIDNNRKILASISAIGFYNLPLDYLDTWTAKVAAVTLADIRSAFQRKVAPDRLATVVVGAPAVTLP